MRTKGNQFVVEVLLLIVITAIVAFTCVNLLDLIDKFKGALENVFWALKA